MVVGYRKLNEDVFSDSLLLPNLGSACHNFLGVRCFTIMHMNSASYQIPWSLRSQRCMAFTAPFFEYKFIKIPTGILLASKF
jgi:hypothetical protein